jgi:two-component sensor histidine kinase
MAGTVLAKLDRMPNDNAARILVADDKPVPRRLVHGSPTAGGAPKASQLQPVSTKTTGEGHGSANTSASQDAHHRLRTSQDDMQVHLTWRADLLNDIVKVAAIAGVLLTAMVIAFRSPPRFDISTYLVMSASLLMLVLRFLPRLPFRLRGGLAIAAIYGSGLPTILRSGFALSSAAVLLSAIVLAVILLGRGPSTLLVVVTAVLLSALAVAAQRGHFVPQPIDSDPRIPRNWVRMAIGFDLVAATLLTAVWYAVRYIERNYTQISAALALLTLEQRRRAGLESERQRTEGDWQRAALELTALGKNGEVEAGNARTAFRAIAEAGARGLGVDRCSIWLFDGARTELRCQDLFERPQGRHSRGMTLAASAAPAYFAALESERSIAAHRARTDPRTRELGPTYLVPLQITSMLDAPIRLQNRVVGVVCNEHIGTAITWSEAQQSFAGSLADFAARVLFAADRTTKALALHSSTEELAERLDALKIRLAGIPSGLDPADDPQALEVVDGLISRVRRLSIDQRLPSLDEVGLIPALRAYLDAQSASSGVRMELDASTFDGRAAPETEVASFWIVQEAVASVLGHGGVQVVSVHLERANGQLRISVEDDGEGFAAGDPSAERSERARVVHLEQRARALGGSLVINSCEGAGTVVQVTLPSQVESPDEHWGRALDCEMDGLFADGRASAQMAVV